MRLRSDRELADLCGVNRMKVRRALDRLEGRGILVRRHGSGTYLRKVPELPALGKGDRVALPKGLTARDLAAAPARDPVRRRLSRRGQQLHLALIGQSSAGTTKANRLIMAGMVEQARQAGHSIVFASLEPGAEDCPSAEQVLRILPEGACDGYLVNATWAAAFGESMGGHPPATVFFYPGKCLLPLQPLIEIETDAGIGRAVRVFVAEGLTRIAMLGSVEQVGGIQDVAYRRAMEDVGLPYRASEFVTAPWKPELVRGGLRRLLDRPDPPQAVYVSDDHCLAPVARELAARGLVPGRDLAVITLANRGIPLPNGRYWSHIEFDPKLVGRMAVDSLLKVVRTAGQALISFAHLPTWRPGDTHTIRAHVQAVRGTEMDFKG